MSLVSMLSGSTEPRVRVDAGSVEFFPPMMETVVAVSVDPYGTLIGITSVYFFFVY